MNVALGPYCELCCSGPRPFNIKKALCRMHAAGTRAELRRSALNSHCIQLSSSKNLFFIGMQNLSTLTAIWLATNPRSGHFSSVLVDTPTLPPVTLLLPVEAVFVTARNESTCHLHAHT